MTQAERMILLEKLIDESSVTELLTEIELICHEKSEHIMCNYQDELLAKAWTKIAESISNAAHTAQNA